MQQKMMATTVGKKSMTVPRVLPSSKASIAAAAETVSLAFAEDPLIEFLYKRPKQQTWASLSPSTQKWQQNRLRHYQLDSNIFEVRVNGLNAGLCILHPPKTWRRLFSCAWIVRYFKAIIFRWINAGSEECCNQNRVGQLFASAGKQGPKIASGYRSGTLHYIPMIVVHPSFQGMGIGGQLMRHLIQEIGDAPSFLECTNFENVPFYEKFGFKVVHEDVLVDAEDSSLRSTLYYMVRGARSEA